MKKYSLFIILLLIVGGYYIYPKLPPLKDEYKTFAKELGSFVCTISTVEKDLKNFTPETFPALVERYQKSNTQFRSLSKEDVLLKFQQLKEDPLQFGLFIGEISGQLGICGTSK